MATTTTTPASGGGMTALLLPLVGAAAALGFVLVQLNSQGHAAFNTTNSGVFWGFAIVIYDVLMMVSVGATMVACLSLALGMKDFDAIARRCLWLALATLVGGVAVLFLELGYPLRALTATPANMALASPLFWKIMLVGAYAVVLVLMCLGATASPVAMIAFLLAAAIALVAGSVYGLMSMRPMWFGTGTIVGYLIEAMVGGLAAAMLVTRLSGDSRADALLGGTLARLLVVALILHLALVGGRVIAGLYGNQEGLQVWQHFVKTPMFHLGFWGGIVLPFLILSAGFLRTSPTMQLLASALVLVGLLIHHYEFIIGGQLVPLFKGSWVRGLIPYTPSPAEWTLLAVGVFVSWLVYAVGASRLGSDRT